MFAIIAPQQKQGSSLFLLCHRVTVKCHCYNGYICTVQVLRTKKFRGFGIPHPFICELQVGAGVGCKNFRLPASLCWKLEDQNTEEESMWRQSKAWRRSEKSAYQIPFVNLTLCLIFKKPPDHSDAHASCLCCRGYRARGESQRQHSQHYNRTPAGTMSHSNVSSGVGVKSGNCKRRK